ncbi:cytochrome P450 94C1-like [Syzygium oleosum]|uniref:cytochrome P450 94C1-like n=1 Tax=Syzygium oleosum TaxID=219896 RepID=UPI0011D2063B|nr:cytochrome P450 94C1-like [Syzygium oleosum]
MERLSSLWLDTPMHSTVCFCFFTFALILALLSLSLYSLRSLQAPLCKCDVCASYLSSSWSSEFGNLCDWYAHLLRNSPTGTIHVHVLRNTITANPGNVEHILRTRFDNYPKGKPFNAILGDLLGRGIFNADGESWQFQRKMASLELGSVSVRAYAFDIVRGEIETRLVPLLTSRMDRGVVDLQDVFRRFSFDSICKFSFGLDPGCLQLSLPMSSFALAFDLASRLSAERAAHVSHVVWKAKRLLNVGSERRLRDAVKLVNALAEQVIRQRRRLGSFATRNDLLSRFMGTVDDEVYLRDVVISFLLAGRDTVASALTGFFWLLSRNPEVERLIREESDLVMDGSTGDVLASYEQMQRMHYLHAAVHEGMRLFPPVQFDSKFASADDVLPDGTVVGGGTRVTYHPYAMGRMERIWGPDCLKFRPERWLQDGVFRPESLYKYPVFQAGRRTCLGREMAVVEMKSVALELVRRFDVRVVGPARQARFSPGLTATMSGGLPVIVRERGCLVKAVAVGC